MPDQPPKKPRPYRVVWHELTCPVCEKTIRLSGREYYHRSLKTCGNHACTVAYRNIHDPPIAHMDAPEHRKARRDAFYASPKSGPYETNVSAKEWHLLSPDGTAYHFRNLSLWLRIHGDLFDPADVEVKPQSTRKGSGYCRAITQLARLRPERRARRYKWKGWRWYDEEDAET